MATTVLFKGVASSLIETTIEMHRKMSAFFQTFAVIPKTLVGEVLVKASEILIANDWNFCIWYASTSGFIFKGRCAYLGETTKIDFVPR
jgi:hypothetical protein